MKIRTGLYVVVSKPLHLTERNLPMKLLMNLFFFPLWGVVNQEHITNHIRTKIQCNFITDKTMLYPSQNLRYQTKGTQICPPRGKRGSRKRKEICELLSIQEKMTLPYTTVVGIGERRYAWGPNISSFPQFSRSNDTLP